MLRSVCVLSLLYCLPSLVSAQGIRGTVSDQQGEDLAFATIYVEQTGSGTTANSERGYKVNHSPAPTPWCINLSAITPSAGK